MSKFEDFKKSVEDGKDPVIALNLEDGSNLYCGVKSIFVMDEKDYIAFHPLHGDYPEVIFFLIRRTEEDDFTFEDIEDDGEYFKVVKTYERLFEQQNKGRDEDQDKAFEEEMEQKLIEECRKDPLDIGNIKKSVEDGEDITVTLALDDDTELECVVIAIFKVQDKDYIALLPREDNDDEQVFLYRLKNTLDSGLEFENIVDDNEFKLVAEAFDALTEERGKGNNND